MRSLVLTLTFLSVVSGELFAQRIPEGTLVCRSRSALELYVPGDSSSTGECERVASESEITVMFDHGDVAMIRVYDMLLYTWVQAAAIQEADKAKRRPVKRGTIPRVPAPSGGPCANARTFVDFLVRSDKSISAGFFSGRYRCQEGLLWLWVTNAWYNFRCHVKEQTYVAIRDAWRSQGGSNLVLSDRIDIVVGDFRFFSSRPKIKGC